MVALRQTSALLKKNFLLKRRRPIRSLFEIILPIVVIFLIASIRKYVPDDMVSREASPIANQPLLVPKSGVVLYAPNSSEGVLAIVEQMKVSYSHMYENMYGTPAGKLEGDGKIVFKGFSSQNELIKHMEHYDHAMKDENATPTQAFFKPKEHLRYLGAVIFENLSKGKEYPVNVRYTLTRPRTAPEKSRASGHWQVEFMQKMTDAAILSVKANAVQHGSGTFKAFMEYVGFVGDASLSEAQNGNGKITAPLMITATFICFLSIIGSPLKDIITEKETRIKEAMKMMGLKAWVNWLSWGLTISFNMLVVVISSTAIVVYFNYFDFVSPSIFFAYNISYCLSVISFIFLISTLFNRSKRAASFLSVFYIASFAPYLVYQNKISSLNSFVQNSVCVANSACMAFGFAVMGEFETQRIMLDWSMLSKSPSADVGGFTVEYCMMMMILDSVIYFLLAYYIDEVFPGEYGVPREKLFFLRPSYWTGVHKTLEYHELPQEVIQDREGAYKPHIEPESTTMVPGVQIRNLTKVYDNGKVAVNNLSLDIYENQITSLLGHNGAGKTTVMSLLSGLFPPTGGDAKICGHDLATDLQGVRRDLGLCPQFDVLFDRLTVMEHLWFFAELKGVSYSESYATAKQHVDELGLTEKLNSYAESLSGGQKRKLSVAIAFVGNSKIVILDEPTSGMDPYSRRATWDLLMKNRKNKTIILSTHFMDEADVLGDRIAIIAKGSLRCVGSSLFLKNIYGVGYHLICEKNEGVSEDELKETEDSVTRFIQSHIPDAIPEMSYGNELSYTIPSKFSESFEAFFCALEDKLNTLKLKGYGISATTLEEVFLAVGNEVDVEDGKAKALTSGDTSMNTSGNSMGNEESSLLGRTLNRRRSESDHLFGVSLIVQQVKAMIVKRALNAFRQKKIWLYQIVYPLFFVYLAFYSLDAGTHAHDPQPSSPNTENVHKQISGSMKVYPFDLSGMVRGSDFPIFVDKGLTGHSSDFAKLFLNELEQGSFKNLFTVRETENINQYFQKPNFVIAGGLSFFNSTILKYSGERQNLLGSFGNGVNEISNIARDSYSKLGVDFVVKHRLFGLKLPELSFSLLLSDISMKNILGGKHGITVNVMDEPERIQKPKAKKRRGILQEGTETEDERLQRVLREVEQDPSLAHRNGYLEKSLGAKSMLDEDLLSEGNGDADMGSSFLYCFYMAFALTLVINAFSMFVVREKATNAKEIQLISSHPVIFWISHFIWDYLMFLIPVGIMVILVFFFNTGPFAGENLGPFTLICMSFGVAGIMQVYLLSLMFDEAAAATSFMNYYNSLTVLVPGIVAMIVKLTGIEDGIWYFVVTYCFVYLPNYMMCSFFFGFLNILGAKQIVSWSETAKNCGHLLGLGVLFFIVLMFFECGVIRHLNAKFQKRKTTRGFRNEVAELQSLNGTLTSENHEREDDDVYRERLRVKEAAHEPEMSGEDILVSDLSKVFGRSILQNCCPTSIAGKEKVAVNQISVGIPSGECFGLLGHNGAGKTTTFKMLTGTIAPSFGNAWLMGKSTVDNYLSARKVIGYCPQENAFIDHLTCREMLTLYAYIRGIKPNLIAEECNLLISSLELSEYENVQCESLSGGNKRKLMTACSLIGDPSILFLDEPSTGMDPKARRVLWDRLHQTMRNDRRCIVLTSHSMEECEALCTRLAIMIDGTFRCLGSPQHLKNKFGSGYILIVKTKTEMLGESSNVSSSSSSFVLDKLPDVMAYLQEALPSSVLVEKQPNMVRYSISQENSSVGQIFGKMEKMKKYFACIEDYSLSQTSLEQVFINFVKASGKDLSAE
eukprot:Nk52_evm5s967 gene=Nk52_evmTU5s967